MQLQALGLWQGLCGSTWIQAAQQLLPMAQGDHALLQFATAAQLPQRCSIQRCSQPGQGQSPAGFAGTQPQRLCRLGCAPAQHHLIRRLALGQPGAEQAELQTFPQLLMAVGGCGKLFEFC